MTNMESRLDLALALISCVIAHVLSGVPVNANVLSREEVFETVQVFNDISRQTIRKATLAMLDEIEENSDKTQVAVVSVLCFGYATQFSKLNFDWSEGSLYQLKSWEADILEKKSSVERGSVSEDDLSGTVFDPLIFTFCPGLIIDWNSDGTFSDLDRYSIINVLYADLLYRKFGDRADEVAHYHIFLLTEMWLNVNSELFRYVFESRFLPIFQNNIEIAKERNFATQHDKFVYLIGVISESM